jgi:hypothetical protein
LWSAGLLGAKAIGHSRRDATDLMRPLLALRLCRPASVGHGWPTHLDPCARSSPPWSLWRLSQLQLSQQQRLLIEQRLRCINQANDVNNLEHCERSYPGSEHMHSGTWNCPMW